jgi:hypothetical protein
MIGSNLGTMNDPNPTSAAPPIPDNTAFFQLIFRPCKISSATLVPAPSTAPMTPPLVNMFCRGAGNLETSFCPPRRTGPKTLEFLAPMISFCPMPLAKPREAPAVMPPPINPKRPPMAASKKVILLISQPFRAILITNDKAIPLSTAIPNGVAKMHKTMPKIKTPANAMYSLNLTIQSHTADSVSITTSAILEQISVNQSQKEKLHDMVIWKGLRGRSGGGGSSGRGLNTTNENVVLGVGDEPVKRWGRDFCSGRKKSASVRFLSGNVGFLG